MGIQQQLIGQLASPRVGWGGHLGSYPASNLWLWSGMPCWMWGTRQPCPDHGDCPTVVFSSLRTGVCHGELGYCRPWRARLGPQGSLSTLRSKAVLKRCWLSPAPGLGPLLKVGGRPSLRVLGLCLPTQPSPGTHLSRQDSPGLHPKVPACRHPGVLPCWRLGSRDFVLSDHSTDLCLERSHLWGLIFLTKPRHNQQAFVVWCCSVLS